MPGEVITRQTEIQDELKLFGIINIGISGEFKQIDVEKEIIEEISRHNITNINSIRNSIIKFDLSSVGYFDIGTLLWFISFLNKLKSLGNDIQIKLPDFNTSSGKTTWSFLNRWKFFDAIEECVDNPINLIVPEQIISINAPSKYQQPDKAVLEGQELLAHTTKLLEITPIKTNIFEYKNNEDRMTLFIRNSYDKFVSSSLVIECGWDNNTVQVFIREILGEGVRNSLKYSKGTFTLIGMKTDNKILNLAICDNGNGIPDVLRNAFTHDDKLRKKIFSKTDDELIKYYTDSELIKLSTNPNVSSDKNSEGMGLFHLKRIVLEMGGELRIRSGNACVDFRKNSPKVYKLLNYPGTLLRIQVPLKAK